MTIHRGPLYSAAEDAALHDAVAIGLSDREIHETILPGRSQESIRNRRGKLGVSEMSFRVGTPRFVARETFVRSAISSPASMCSDLGEQS